VTSAVKLVSCPSVRDGHQDGQGVVDRGGCGSALPPALLTSVAVFALRTPSRCRTQQRGRHLCACRGHDRASRRCRGGELDASPGRRGGVRAPAFAGRWKDLSTAPHRHVGPGLTSYSWRVPNLPAGAACLRLRVGVDEREEMLRRARCSRLLATTVRRAGGSRSRAASGGRPRASPQSRTTWKSSRGGRTRSHAGMDQWPRPRSPRSARMWAPCKLQHRSATAMLSRGAPVPRFSSARIAPRPPSPSESRPPSAVPCAPPSRHPSAHRTLARVRGSLFGPDILREVRHDDGGSHATCQPSSRTGGRQNAAEVSTLAR